MLAVDLYIVLLSLFSYFILSAILTTTRAISQEGVTHGYWEVLVREVVLNRKTLVVKLSGLEGIIVGRFC